VPGSPDSCPAVLDAAANEPEAPAGIRGAIEVAMHALQVLVESLVVPGGKPGDRTMTIVQVLRAGGAGIGATAFVLLLALPGHARTLPQYPPFTYADFCDVTLGTGAPDVLARVWLGGGIEEQPWPERFRLERFERGLPWGRWPADHQRHTFRIYPRRSYPREAVVVADDKGALCGLYYHKITPLPDRLVRPAEEGRAAGYKTEFAPLPRELKPVP
jgi:hypothetical protein